MSRLWTARSSTFDQSILFSLGRLAQWRSASSCLDLSDFDFYTAAHLRKCPDGAVVQARGTGATDPSRQGLPTMSAAAAHEPTVRWPEPLDVPILDETKRVWGVHPQQHAGHL